MAADTKDITGLDELQRLLDELPALVERKLMRGGLRAGTKVLLTHAQRHINDRTGALSKSLRVKTSGRQGKVTATLTAGNKKAFYAHMVEHGTAAHFIKPKKRKSLFLAGLARETAHHPGAKKKPFMRPALDGGAVEAVDAMAAYLRTRIDKENLKRLPDEADDPAGTP
jgi:HK97 gp10 family phage protein